jgi:hypothetical protein
MTADEQAHARARGAEVRAARTQPSLRTAPPAAR